MTMPRARQFPRPGAIPESAIFCVIRLIDSMVVPSRSAISARAHNSRTAPYLLGKPLLARFDPSCLPFQEGRL